MVKIGPVSEDEVVLAFLRGEIDSPRFGPSYSAILTNSRLSRVQLIDNADLSNVSDNHVRSELLKAVRGYRAGTYLFHGFPPSVRWGRVRLEPPEVGQLRYANYPTWIQLSNGSRLVADGARNVDRVQTQENTNDNIRAVAFALKAGQRYPELITAESHDGALILIEGHTRATAYVLSGLSESVDCFVASSPAMRGWAFY